MSSAVPARPNRRSRAREEAGPKARVRDLLPYLSEHRAVLAVVVVLSLLTAVTSLLQPLLVQQVVQRVQQGLSLGGPAPPWC